MNPNDEIPAGETRPSASPEGPAKKFRYRARFAKHAGLRFISHQDLLHAWERLLRRTKLPLRFSEGFHAKPRISSPLALALGIEADEEVLDFELSERFEAAEVERRLSAESVPGLEAIRIELLPTGSRMDPVIEVEYRAVIEGGFDESDVSRRRDELFAADRWMIERKTPNKPVRAIDLRPKLKGIAIKGNEITLTLLVENGSTARPEEVLVLLGLGDRVRDGVVRTTRARVELERSASEARPEHRSRQEGPCPAV